MNWRRHLPRWIDPTADALDIAVFFGAIAVGVVGVTVWVVLWLTF